jgi:hypothetical protein
MGSGFFSEKKTLLMEFLFYIERMTNINKRV